MGDMKGLLRVSGTIDLSQFWPNGDSDVDTANGGGRRRMAFSSAKTPRRKAFAARTSSMMPSSAKDPVI